MAIQMRRGAYTNYDPTKLVPGEIAVVQSGDPIATDGKAVYIAITAGSAKRLILYDEAQGIIQNYVLEQTQDIIDDIHEGVEADVQRAESAAATFETDKTLTVTDKAADAKAVGDALNNLDVDATLTRRGKPADAKVVGDEINDIKADLSDNSFFDNRKITIGIRATGYRVDRSTGKIVARGSMGNYVCTVGTLQLRAGEIITCINENYGLAIFKFSVSVTSVENIETAIGTLIYEKDGVSRFIVEEDGFYAIEAHKLDGTNIPSANAYETWKYILWIKPVKYLALNNDNYAIPISESIFNSSTYGGITGTILYNPSSNRINVIIGIQMPMKLTVSNGYKYNIVKFEGNTTVDSVSLTSPGWVTDTEYAISVPGVYGIIIGTPNDTQFVYSQVQSVLDSFVFSVANVAQDVISELQDALDAEIETRENADTALENDLDIEASIREDAVSSLGINVNTLRNQKVNLPVNSQDTPVYGTRGQVLTTNGDGSTSWETAGTPTYSQAEAIINAWLNNHPEATTTVPDGSISQNKLTSALSESADFVKDLQLNAGTLHVLNGIRFYVDATNGNDETGDGSASKPWKTLDKFFAEANRIDGGRIDLRCFLVTAGTYSVRLDENNVSHTFNHLTLHITGQTSGCIVQFETAEDVKFYECHCNFNNITIKAPNATEFAFDGGSVAIKSCTFDCDVVMYAIQGYIETCSVKTLDMNECGIILAGISITNTDPNKDAIQLRSSTVRFQGSWQNVALSEQGVSGHCFIRAVQSFVLIGITFRLQTNTYYNGLINSVSFVFILTNTEKTLRERSQQGNLNNGGIIMICNEAVQQGVVNIENMQSNVRYVEGTGLQYYDGSTWKAIS